MEDEQIIALYFQRDQRAITETAVRYGPQCYQIAYHILNDRQDAEECVNDTYLSAWEHIPPARPRRFSAYLGQITRSLSIDRWRSGRAGKRGGGQLTLAVEELDRTLSDGTDLEELVLRGELRDLLNQFLRQLPVTERRVFLCRYWYMDPVFDIARSFGFTQSKVKSMLMRTRKKLKRFLMEQGGLEP